MSWTNKAVLAWGWILTPEEIATLSDEVYEEWLDNVTSGDYQKYYENMYMSR